MSCQCQLCVLGEGPMLTILQFSDLDDIFRFRRSSRRHRELATKKLEEEKYWKSRMILGVKLYLRDVGQYRKVVNRMDDWREWAGWILDDEDAEPRLLLVKTRRDSFLADSNDTLDFIIPMDLVPDVLNLIKENAFTELGLKYIVDRLVDGRSKLAAERSWMEWSKSKCGIM